MKLRLATTLGIIAAFSCLGAVPHANGATDSTSATKKVAPVPPENPELFDVSGMPPVPTSFSEQQIQSLIAGHHPGDLNSAEFIQNHLAGYYAEKGDQRRAEQARARARAAWQALHPSPTPPPVTAPADSTAASAANAASAPKPAVKAIHSDFKGNFYVYRGNSEEMWEFYEDGTYLHRSIAAGGGTSVGVSERGSFVVAPDRKSIELRVTKTTSAYSAPTVGGKGTALGAGSDQSRQVRVLKLNLNGPKGPHGTGIILGGVPLNVRPW